MLVITNDRFFFNFFNWGTCIESRKVSVRRWTAKHQLLCQNDCKLRISRTVFCSFELTNVKNKTRLRPRDRNGGVVETVVQADTVSCQSVCWWRTIPFLRIESNRQETITYRMLNLHLRGIKSGAVIERNSSNGISSKRERLSGPWSSLPFP